MLADGLEHFVAVAFGMFDALDADARAEQQPGERRFALDQWPPPQVVAIERQKIEGARHGGVVGCAAMQLIELRHALGI